MKVLLVHNSYQYRGGEDIVFEQERQLLERTGHQVVTYRRSNWEVEAYSGIRRLGLAKKTVWANDTWQEVARLLHQEKPQLVHVHNTFMMVSPAVYAACHEAGVPVLQTLHNYRLFCPAANFYRDGKVCEECVVYSLWRGVRYGCYRGSHAATAVVALMLAVHRRRHTWTQTVDRYVALTEFARQKFIEGGLPAGKISVKPNFVYPDPGEGTADGRKYALFAGRQSPEKGLLTLLAAWERLRNVIPLVIVGDGPLCQRLEAEVGKRGLLGISFRGRLNREETWAVLKAARFLIFPSECFENFPLGVVEAFACGTPVICSRLGAMQEIVVDGRTGLHFKPGDPEDLAAKVEWACARPEKVAAMGREARAEYEAKYTGERNYPMLMDIYERTLYSKV